MIKATGTRLKITFAITLGQIFRIRFAQNACESYIQNCSEARYMPLIVEDQSWQATFTGFLVDLSFDNGKLLLLGLSLIAVVIL